MQRKGKTSYSIIGGMAGSSMDGLDLAYVHFTKTSDGWIFDLKKSEVIAYPEDLYDQLKDAINHDKTHKAKLDLRFGTWISNAINEFKKDLPDIDILGIHGHTVIHEPKNKVSWQLGDGQTIANRTGIPAVTDFRTLDVENNGQGAPLVPFGDFELFHEYDACLNLGGIANISVLETREAWDICPCNQVLNFFAQKLGKNFDYDGKLAKQGNFISSFYSEISSMSFFSVPPPKSLPNNFISNGTLDQVQPEDGLNTYCQFVADQIGASLKGSGKLLVTGGGAFNGFLIEKIKESLESWSVVIPDQNLITFKESLVFAFLALRRFRNETNTLSSVTGASKDLSSGVIHLPE